MKNSLAARVLTLLLICGSTIYAADPAPLLCELHPVTKSVYGREFSYIVLTNISDHPIRLAVHRISPSSRGVIPVPAATKNETYASPTVFQMDTYLPVFYGEARDSDDKPFSIGSAVIATSLKAQAWDPKNVVTLWPHAKVTCASTPISPRPAAATLHFLQLIDQTFHPLNIALTVPNP